MIALLCSVFYGLGWFVVQILYYSYRNFTDKEQAEILIGSCFSASLLMIAGIVVVIIICLEK